MTISSSQLQTITELQAKITRLEQENRKLKRLIAIDPLTQLANRKAFEHRLHEEWKRARRNQSVISLLVINVDEIPTHEPRQKQQPGTALQRLAFTLARVPRRSTDLFARSGNTEFAVILPDTPAQGARKLAELFLQQAHFSDVVLSIGVATAVPSQNDFRQLLDSATQALQRAQQQGGNCLEIAHIA